MLPLLAIDSSTERAGLALFDGSDVAELGWEAGRNQTVALLAQVHRLLELNGIAPTDLGALAVTTGPGTFNGVRVGLSVAKGLVLALGLPLLGVSTLAATAYPVTCLGLPVVAVVAAGRERIVWAEFRPGAGAPEPASEPRNASVSDLADHLARRSSPVVVTGDVSASLAAALAEVPAATLPPPALRFRRPAAVAALAWDRFAAGEADDPAALEPVYVGRASPTAPDPGTAPPAPNPGGAGLRPR